MSFGVVSVTAETDCSLTVPLSVTAVSGKTAFGRSLDRRDRCLDDMLKNETLMFNIYRGNINLLSLFVLFSFLCCLSLVSYDRKLVEKIIHR